MSYFKDLLGTLKEILKTLKSIDSSLKKIDSCVVNNRRGYGKSNYISTGHWNG